MKKLLAIALCVVSVAAIAQRMPTIIGYVKNKANGEITFTTEQGHCNRDSGLLAYIRDNGGRIAMVGCWRMVDSEVFVVWSDGDLFSYGGDAIQFTEEWLRYSERNSGSR